MGVCSARRGGGGGVECAGSVGVTVCVYCCCSMGGVVVASRGVWGVAGHCGVGR